MASARAPSIRQLFRRRPQLCCTTQRRWARVHDVRFLTSHGVQERVMAKYREKLDRKAKEEGLSNVHELKNAYKNKIEEIRRKEALPSATAAFNPPSAHAGPQPPPPAPPQTPSDPSQSSSTPPGIKTLSSFLDLPKVMDLERKEIEYIWRLRHASNPRSLCAVVPAGTYEAMAAVARQHPHFILPVPRADEGGGGGNAAQIHLLQWSFPTPTTASVIFTELAEYKARGEFSQPHTVVTHHLDLAGPKGLVLLEGSVMDGREVSVEDAKWLLMCLQKFYGVGAEDTPRRELLRQFSRGDSHFNVQKLLEEAERVG